MVQTAILIPMCSLSRFRVPTATRAATFYKVPGWAQSDVSVTKKWSLSERLNLQFRAEFLNVFNHTNFNAPSPVVFTASTGGPSPTAGVITSTSTSSRQIQLGLKLLW